MPLFVDQSCRDDAAPIAPWRSFDMWFSARSRLILLHAHPPGGGHLLAHGRKPPWSLSDDRKESSRKILSNIGGDRSPIARGPPRF